MNNALVRFAKAGDAFHYRWAARRCLKLLQPNSTLDHITIEGSETPASKLVGEYVIDTAEYATPIDADSVAITYFQLKHTVTNKLTNLTLRALSKTITGFANRFRQQTLQSTSPHPPRLAFAIITNRPVAPALKTSVGAIGRGEQLQSATGKTLQKYTGLQPNDLVSFCRLLTFVDTEGDYEAQKQELRTEIAQLVAGTVDGPLVDSLTAMVEEKALPNSDGRIVREDVLKRFRATSERDLYPAPALFEQSVSPILRQQHSQILERVLTATTPIIIHAAGGVGKSIFANQLARSLPNGSIGIVYDCFGGGSYRNRSEPRHRHRDMLVQIGNQLAAQGLCEPLIVLSSALNDEITRSYQDRLKQAINSLRKVSPAAQLVIMIDAADNAEMAAAEFSEPCVAHELLREDWPDGCTLIALCRTERISLLQPTSTVVRLELAPFSVSETLLHLRQAYPEASTEDGLEFHRLTTGNPRVQANALQPRQATVSATLGSLGPYGSTVERQIEALLTSAVNRVKDLLPRDFRSRIDAICQGLAILPPLVPIAVLAQAAGAEEAAIKSLVSDLGRALWLTDTAVQFRDEPTETWFRNTYSATSTQIGEYVVRLEPLTANLPYVAEAIPSLLLQSGQYETLLKLALSDRLLPTTSPIDERNARLFRLQFAFKAALRLEAQGDAVRLALRAGEEMAGNQRQLELLRANTDLVEPLLGFQRVQELAYRRELRSKWAGSENVYAAALLGSANDFKGEARAYLRAAENWITIYFQEQAKDKTAHINHELEVPDIVDMANAYLNLQGAKGFVDFVQRWKPKEIAVDIAAQVIRRLIDAGDFQAIDDIAQVAARDQYISIALAHELLTVARFSSKEALEQSLELLSNRRTRIAKPTYRYKDTTPAAIASFIEACAARSLPTTKILRVLRYYFPARAVGAITSNHDSADRDTFLRMLALGSTLSKTPVSDLEEFVPQHYIDDKKGSFKQEIVEFKELVGSLLPWYSVRARILTQMPIALVDDLSTANTQSQAARESHYRDRDVLPFDIARVCASMLLLVSDKAPDDQVRQLVNGYLGEQAQLRLAGRIQLVRGAYRIPELKAIAAEAELRTQSEISSKNDDPMEKAERYIDLARAVFAVSTADAATYFNAAIDAVSKFGDEIGERWEAIASLARRSAGAGQSTPELAHRYMRGVELVSEYISNDSEHVLSEAARTCARLSPNVGLATLSRWRDREVGKFAVQIAELAYTLVNAQTMSPSLGWPLSAFFDQYLLLDFAILCVEKETSQPRRQAILDEAIWELGLYDAPTSSWDKLREIAERHALDHGKLDRFLNQVQDIDPQSPANIPRPSATEEREKANWPELLDDLPLDTAAGISTAINRRATRTNRSVYFNDFWPEVFRRIPESEASTFLGQLVMAEAAGLYDIESALLAIPASWRKKASVSSNWEPLLQSIARRFASKFTNRYILAGFWHSVGKNQAVPAYFRQGVVEGLAGNSHLGDADSYFGFVELISDYISIEEATRSLDFALARLERHIDSTFADGDWSTWLVPPIDQVVAVTGLIWSALGSPHASERWQAAHCVRRFGLLDNRIVFEKLLEWLELDAVGACGSSKYPFYKLHARQYLFIALARVSIDQPGILRAHSQVFVDQALTSQLHILIQIFAANIAQNIERAFPGTYEAGEIQRLSMVGKSPLPSREFNRFTDKLRSVWHEQGTVDSALEFSHSWDFDRYWFDPLGEVFGLPDKDIVELATQIVRKTWQVKTDGIYTSDPRNDLWQASRNNRAVWHDHGSYPRVDNYSFYLSYHSMMVVAAMLLQNMPVVHSRSWVENAWADWLHRHQLTRADGYWLSDRRDPAPFMVPNWQHTEPAKDWRSGLTITSCLDALLREQAGVLWFNVGGSWHESDSSRTETFYVSSALVAVKTSQALLNALTNCPDPNDFRLPDYGEERMEHAEPPFEMSGWIWRPYTDNRLDQYDEYAAQISFPPYQVGSTIASKLGLVPDREQRQWFTPHATEASLLSEVWSSGKHIRHEEPLRHGNCLSASLGFLRHLCATFECDLVIRVQIERQFKERLYQQNEDEPRFIPPLSAVYLLSAAGTLRDTTTSYELGETPG